MTAWWGGSRVPVVSGWLNQQRLQLVGYLREENRVRREQWAKGDYASTMTSIADWP